MSSIVTNSERVGNFTSSEIYNLIKLGTRDMTPQELEAHKLENPKSRKKTIAAGFAEGGQTYIAKKRRELRLGRSFNLAKYSRPSAWGQFMEQYIFDYYVPFNYDLISDESFKHPTVNGWSGSPDLFVEHELVGDIKAYEPEAFTKYVDGLSLAAGDCEIFKRLFPQQYWQLISNAEIMGVNQIEAVAFMPYENELDNVRESASNYDGPDQWKYRFIAEAPAYELPYIPAGSNYRNYNSFKFNPPREDFELLKNRVKEAQRTILKLK